MPYKPNDPNRYPHLPLFREARTQEARKSTGRPPPGGGPSRGTRQQFAQEIVKRVGQLATATTRRLQTLGVDPALVLRFELADQPDLVKMEKQLADAGLTVVAVE